MVIIKGNGIMMKKYLALFDLDGTLFDTSEVNYFSYKKALADYGIKLDKEYFVKECNGRHFADFLPQIMGGTEHINAVHMVKKSLYKENLGKARINRHLFEMIKAMRDHYHLAIVTTASKQNVLDILTCFGYHDFFEYMISQEDITRVKPDPQGFQMAMNFFGASPEDTVIFEDSDMGIQAARATGATVMVVDRF